MSAFCCGVVVLSSSDGSRSVSCENKAFILNALLDKYVQCISTNKHKDIAKCIDRVFSSCGQQASHCTTDNFNTEDNNGMCRTLMLLAMHVCEELSHALQDKQDGGDTSADTEHERNKLNTSGTMLPPSVRVSSSLMKFGSGDLTVRCGLTEGGHRHN